MSEPEITVTKATAFIQVPTEFFPDLEEFREAFMATLTAPPTPCVKPPDPGPHPGYLLLLESAGDNGVLRELLELHCPKAEVYPKADGMAPHIHWHCEGEPPSGYEWDYADWPCDTTAVIAKHLGVGT